MVQLTWQQLLSPHAYVESIKAINVPRLSCFLIGSLCSMRTFKLRKVSAEYEADAGAMKERSCVVRVRQRRRKTERGTRAFESIMNQMFVLPTAIKFLKEFFVGTERSRRESLLFFAVPACTSVLRMRMIRAITAKDVVDCVFLRRRGARDRKTNSDTDDDNNNKTIINLLNTKKTIAITDPQLVNSMIATVFCAVLIPEDARAVEILPGGKKIQIFSEKFKFGPIDLIQLPNLNLPRVGNFIVFDVYSKKFGGNDKKAFKYNLFLTPKYIAWDLPRFTIEEVKRSKLGKSKCIVKSQKFNFEVDLIKLLNPFTLPKRVFVKSTKLAGKAINVTVVKPAVIVKNKFCKHVLGREQREPRVLTFLERVQQFLGLLPEEEIEPPSPGLISKLPFVGKKPDAPPSQSGSKANSQKSSKANSRAQSGTTTPSLTQSRSQDNRGGNFTTPPTTKNNVTSSSSTSRTGSQSDLSQVLPKLKSFQEIREDIDQYFQGTKEEQEANKKKQEEAKKKLEEQESKEKAKKQQREQLLLAERKERELKEAKKQQQMKSKAAEEDALLKKKQRDEEEEQKRKAEADGRRMAEVNQSYFNRYVPDVADNDVVKGVFTSAPTAIEAKK